MSRIMHIPTDKEVRALINSIHKERYHDRALVELLYGNGICRTEAANLEVEDVDFNRDLIRCQGCEVYPGVFGPYFYDKYGSVHQGQP